MGDNIVFWLTIRTGRLDGAALREGAVAMDSSSDSESGEEVEAGLRVLTVSAFLLRDDCLSTPSVLSCQILAQNADPIEFHTTTTPTL